MPGLALRIFSVLFCLMVMSSVVMAQAVDATEQTLTTFSVKDITGGARTHWQVRGGVPFAKGVLQDPALLRLRDDQGQALPASTRTLAKWDDGSIKWLLINTLTDLPAHGQREISINLQKTPAAKSNASPALLATEDSRQIILDNGNIRLTFPRDTTSKTLWQVSLPDAQGKFTPLNGAADSVLCLQSTPPGEPDLNANWLRQASTDPGQYFNALRDTQRTVSIEENSPQHAIVRLDGWHVNAQGRRVFPYTLRIDASRGSSRLQMAYTFTATEDVQHNFVRSLVVTVPGVDHPARAMAGLPQGKIQELALDDAGGMLSIRNIGTPRHYDNVSYEEANPIAAVVSVRDAAGKWSETPAGVDAPGWFIVGNDHYAASIGFRDFGHMHPKELAADGQGQLYVYLWPARGDRCLDLRRRSQTLRPEFVENEADPYGGRGIAVTHEWQLAYTSSPLNVLEKSALVNEAAAAAKAACQPLQPIAQPAYIAATGAFGEFLPAGTKGFEQIDRALNFAVRYLHALRNAYELDGMIDWGDVPIAGVGAINHIGKSNPKGLVFQGYNGWLNNDWGLAHGLFLHALRTGDPQALLDAQNMTRHVMDVDTIHYYPENPENVGRGRRHDQQHWGNGARYYCYAPYATIDHFLLTGEGRAYDVAKVMADNPVGYGRYSTIRFWEISGDPAYLAKAMAFLQEDLKGNADGWPFLYGQNFRSNSYDGIGYTFFDSIHPDPRLTAAAVKALDLKQRDWLTPWINPGHPTHLLASLAHRAAPTPAHTRELQAMVWYVLQGKINGHSEEMDLSPDADFATYVKVNQATLNIGRTDMLALYYLIGMPRVMARLAAAGVDENTCLNFSWQWEDQPSFTETFDPRKIRRSAELRDGKPRPGFEHEYDYYTEHDSPGYRPDARYGKEITAQWLAAVGRTRMYEDGKLIGPSSWPRAQMRTEGIRGWTRRLSGAAAFTTTDNSDPRTNGRKYTLAYTSAADEKWHDVPSFTQTLDPAHIMPFGPTGHAWSYRLDQPLPQQVSVYPPRPADVQAYKESLERHVFLIDGQSQGDIQPSENWGIIWKARVQGWARCENLIMFTLPEGIDPRTDGRTYEFRYTAKADSGYEGKP